MAEAPRPAPAFWLPTVDSTNAEARRRIEAGEGGPLWIAAERQTAGRGRRGRVWSTGAGNLAATLLTTTDKPPAQAAEVAFVAALAVADLAVAYAPEALVRLKWPNDVLLAGRKLAGVLIETGVAPVSGRWLAIGCGVNLASAPSLADHPLPAAALADHPLPAAALADHLRGGRATAPSPAEALERLAIAFAGWRRVWLDEGFAAVRAAWTARAHGLGQRCVARLEHDTVEGVARGLADDGALLLDTSSGPRAITAGDVFFPDLARVA